MSFRRGHLEYFVAVAEEGQVTSAARRLGVAQPAVSQAMAQLESETGLQLLERHARGVRLTPAGESFYAKARLAVAATGDAVSTARSLARAQQGTIEFGFRRRASQHRRADRDGRLRDGLPGHRGALPGPALPEPLDLRMARRGGCRRMSSAAARRRGLEQSDPPRAACGADPRASIRSPRASSSTSPRSSTRPTSVSIPLSIPAGPASGAWTTIAAGPPERLTDDQAGNPQEVLAALGTRSAITVVPLAAARRALERPRRDHARSRCATPRPHGSRLWAPRPAQPAGRRRCSPTPTCWRPPPATGVAPARAPDLAAPGLDGVGAAPGPGRRQDGAGPSITSARIAIGPEGSSYAVSRRVSPGGIACGSMRTL